MNTTKATPITSTPDINKTHKSLAFISERILTLAFIPSNISIKCYEFQVTKYQKHLYSKLSISLPESINNAVPKRQAEFLAGRYSAISALNALGVNCRNIVIGKHRSPVWPNSIIASITHTTTTSICAASYKDNYQYLGIDIEYVISTELINEIKRSIITFDEEAILRKCSMKECSTEEVTQEGWPLSFSQVFTLVFSAKESLFKALYSSVGYYFDFSAANISQINTDKNSFTLVLTENLTTELTKGREFTGFFDQIGQQIITFIAQKKCCQ
jgi:enterobactin synthetase component D